MGNEQRIMLPGGLSLWNVVLLLLMVLGWWANQSSFQTKVTLTEEALGEDITELKADVKDLGIRGDRLAIIENEIQHLREDGKQASCQATVRRIYVWIRNTR